MNLSCSEDATDSGPTDQGTTGGGGSSSGAGGASAGTSGSGGLSSSDGGASGGTESGGGAAAGGSNAGSSSGGTDAAGGAAGTGTGGAETGGTNSGGGSPSGGDGGGPGSGGAMAILPQADCPPTADLGVRIVGRHDGCTEGAIRISWSGTGFVARFDGEGLRVTQSGNSVQYTVVVDGVVGADVVTTDGESTFDVVSGLSPGEHVVEVYRRGEANFGTTTLLSVEVDNGSLLPPPAAPERRIEIFGDSITCGYGNEGTSSSCSFSADTENHYLTYGAILARHFGAELSTIAWSGKGVVVNYGGDMSTTLPEMIDRAVPGSTSSVWDYALVTPPQAVIINLGTNDYSTDYDPSDADFQRIYEEMLTTLRERYPGAFILCTLGPLLSGTDLSTARANIEAAVQARKASGDPSVATYEMEPNNPDPGCDWHPSLATHDAMAQELIPVLEQALGW